MFFSALTQKALKPQFVGSIRTATTATASKTAAGKSVKEAWLSDTATYPLLAIITGGLVCATGFGIKFCATCPDVQISKAARKSKLSVN
mmetsp:Transcript_31861/g.49999  ORF Transcript_31861/g.49999 Transcript_31861/m.49999 type:complete len:89 (-) Transcript_31861:281-547(-)